MVDIKVLFFDIILEEQRDPDHNQQFATAIKQANNVILFQYLHREILPLPARKGAAASEGGGAVLALVGQRVANRSATRR